MKKILYIANPESIHDIKWISFFSARPDEYTCYLLSEKDQFISKGTEAKLKELNIALLPPIDCFSIRRPFRTWRSIFQLRKLIKTIQPDLLHVLFATPFALWINYVSVRSMITLRGSDILKVIPSLLEQKGLKKYYFKWLYRKFEQAFQKVECVTCTSRSQEIKVRELFPETQIHLIRTGIDVDRITSLKGKLLSFSLPANKKVVLSPRYFSPVYHIELQLKAIELLDEELLNKLFFVFIRGNTYEPSYAQRIASDLKLLQENKGLDYLILDQLDQEELWTLNHHADLCMMTPLSDGTPNTALEAMATRTPLILPPLSYDNELFEENCFILKNYDPTELAQAIISCTFLYPISYIEKAFENVHNFGNRNIEMTRLEELYFP